MVLTDKGFVRPTFDVLLERQIKRAKKLFGEDIDTSDKSVFGKFIRIQVYDLAECYELLEDVYYARFPNSARGQSLDRLCPFSGVVRDPATASRLKVRFKGNTGAIIPIAFLIKGSDQTFYVDNDYTIGEDGYAESYAYCTEPGICGNLELGTELSIVNPAADIQSVELLEITEYGQNEESDTALRIRFNKSVAGAGSSTIDAIRGAIYRVPLVDGVTIIENETDQTVEGRPPHSFECYVLAPESQDQLVAEAIFRKKPLGIRAIGEVEVPVVDKGNIVHFIHFSRTIQKEIYIQASILVNQFFEISGEGQIKDNLMNYINNLTNGESVYLSSLYGYIHEIHGVVNVQNLKMSDNGTVFNTENIVIKKYEIARIRAEHIEITVIV